MRGVRVFDGDQVVDADTVVVRSGSVAAVGHKLPADAGVPVIDTNGGTLLPGLIDAHVHTPDGTLDWATSHQRQALAVGVTTVLCMGTKPTTALAMKARATQQNDLADLRSAGSCATAPGGHPTQWGDGSDPTIASISEAEAFVSARHDEGMDYIKIVIEDSVGRPCPCLSPELTRALVDAAHARDLLTVAHVSKRWHAEQAIAAGVDGLAHQFNDEDMTSEIAAQLAGADMFVVMTLACFYAYEGPRLVADQRIGPYLHSASREHLGTSQVEHVGNVDGGGPSPKGQRVVGAVSALRTAGVTVLAGTDSPGIGAVGPSLHLELELLAQGGLTPMQALQAATSSTADRFRLADRGRIQPGLRADLVLVNGDPTTNIDCTKSIQRVWRGGIELDRDGYRNAVAE